MRRHLKLVALILAFAGGFAPASASVIGIFPEREYDFELTTQACANAEGSASVDLTSSGDALLLFKGTVICSGATSASINSLMLTPVLPPGASASGSTASCGPCNATPIVAQGSAPAFPGLYKVRMSLSALGPGGHYNNRVREAGFLVGAAVQPIRICQRPAYESADPATLTECPF